jgi:hypothetical protein
VAEGFATLRRRDEELEQAEIDVDGNVTVSHFYGALQRGAERSHFCNQRKSELVSIPGALLLQQLDGQVDNGFEQVVEGAIDRLFDFGHRTIVRNGDSQEVIPGVGFQDTRRKAKREIGNLLAFWYIGYKPRETIVAGQMRLFERSPCQNVTIGRNCLWTLLKLFVDPVDQATSTQLNAG